MDDKKYELRFLPLFEDDLNEIVDHIANKLKNPKAANELVNEVEEAIFKGFLTLRALNHIGLPKNVKIHITL